MLAMHVCTQREIWEDAVVIHVLLERGLQPLCAKYCKHRDNDSCTDCGAREGVDYTRVRMVKCASGQEALSCCSMQPTLPLLVPSS